MTVEHPPSPAAFADRVAPYLAEHEAEHGLLLGLTGGGRATPPPRWAYAALAVDDRDDRDGRVAAVALRTDDRLVLSRATSIDAVSALTLDALDGERRAAVRAVHGPSDVIDAFVASSGTAWRETMRQGVYAVDTVIAPPPTPGARRVAEPRDLDSLAAWAAEFEAEALGERRPPEALAAGIMTRIAHGALHVWEVDGRAVASASSAGPTPRGIRVNFVYTPPALRGRGYASALVASLTQSLLDGGRAFVMLHTDLANPLANRVYERIGYVRVAEVRVVAPV